MGLDNGIIVRFNKKPRIMPKIEKCVCGDDISFDAAYWRKCWDLRNDILEVVTHSVEAGYTPLDAKDINKIIKVLQLHNIKEVYETTDRYWEWEEIHPTFNKQIRDLTWLKIYMTLFPKNIKEVYFYDSY